MNESDMTKEEIALELALSFLNRYQPINTDHSPEGEGKAIAALYNAILENINI